MIQFARRIRGPAGPLAALVAVAMTAASAAATSSNSITISGPKHVQAGQRVKLRFTGYGTREVTRLLIWLDDRRCAASAKAEGARANLQSPTKFPVSGSFNDVLNIKRSTTGTHMVCSYLVRKGTEATAYRATWRYVTR
jgi:hypothetical protein